MSRLASLAHLSRLAVLVPFALLAACQATAAKEDTTTPEGDPETPEVLLPSAKATQMVHGSQHACALVEGGTVRCWGWEAHGQTGRGAPLEDTAGSESLAWVPVQVAGLTGVKQIGSMDNTVCAVTASGGAKCWGQDDHGQLGTGIPYTDARPKASNVPVDVKDLASGVVQIDVGVDFGCAVLATGGIKCWGFDEYGKLGNDSQRSAGDGSPEDVPPVDVKGITDAAQVSVGFHHACAVTKAGKAYCWGMNADGELGLGEDDGSDVKVATEVAALGTNVASISAGFDVTCAVMKDGGAKCWGKGDDGALGDGDTGIIRKVTSPKDVLGLGPGSGVTQISKPRGYTCAVVNGGAQCWGNSKLALSSLPVGTVTYAPKGNVPGLESGVAEVYGGSDAVCARLTNGGVKCWGDGYAGQLGDGKHSQAGDYRTNTPGPVKSLP